MKLKNTFRIAGLAALSFAAGGLTNQYELSPKTISFRDVDEDGRDDIIISTRNNKTAYIFLERDGEYVKLENLTYDKDSKRRVEDNVAELKGFSIER